jgi:hypothetical protein
MWWEIRWIVVWTATDKVFDFFFSFYVCVQRVRINAPLRRILTFLLGAMRPIHTCFWACSWLVER